MNEVVYTQDISSGRIHKRYRMSGGNLASFEGCNLDDAGDYRVVAFEGVAEPGAALPEIEGHGVVQPFTLCRNCFPEDDGSTQPAEMVP